MVSRRRDRISELPADILDHILGFLPIKDAAKIAVLSSVWRDVWSNLTRLNFDYDFFSYIDMKHRGATKYVKNSAGLFVMNKVLLQHNGTIRKFVLNFSNAGTLATRSRTYDFDQWLVLVTQKGVEEIHLGFVPSIYKLPNYIFSCLTLKVLHLYGVILEPMKLPCILPNVGSLYFERVDFGPGPMNLLDCAIDIPVLENLSFITCTNMFHFDISAPKLCSLTIDYCFPHELGKFLPVNLDLKSISTLDIHGTSLQKFVNGFTGTGLRLQPLELNVENLKLSIFCDDSIFAFVHLLQMCPKLCKLDINLVLYRMGTKCIDTLSKLHDAAQTNKMLRALKLTSFRGSQFEVIFIRELLVSFSTLEKVVIVCHEKFHCSEEFRRITQEVLCFPRASTEVEFFIV